MTRSISPKPIIRSGDALIVESTIEGQVKPGPFAYSLPEIVRWLGDDATRIHHREGNEWRDLTEELAAIWIGMQRHLTPFDAVPEYVKGSEEYRMWGADYTTELSSQCFGSYERQHRITAGQVR